MTATLAPVAVELALSDSIDAKCDHFGCEFWQNHDRRERDYELPYGDVNAHIAITGHTVTVTAEFRTQTQYGPPEMHP